MRNIFKALFIAMAISLFIMRPVLSYADWNGHDDHGHNGGGHGHDGGHGHSFVSVNLSVWPGNYYYGAPYYPYYPPDEVLVSPAPVYEQPVTVVQQPTVVVNQEEPAAPTITTVGPASDAPDSITVNIPNNKGGYTAVTLKKSGNGFVGPQGEFYQEFPKVSQLVVMYGK